MKKHDYPSGTNAQRQPAATRAETPSSQRGALQAQIDQSPRMLAQRRSINAMFGGAIQLQSDERGVDEPVQRQATPVNQTGITDQLKAGIEALSGMDMSDVRVHRNSDKPAQLNALAYAQGNEIHLGAGQEQHLPHEAWHVVQQRQGRVQPTMQMKGGVHVNDDQGLGQEADSMGGKAAALPDPKPIGAGVARPALLNEVVQRVVAPSYARKEPRAVNTPIPTTPNGKWKRPEWLRGERGAVTTLIGDLTQAGKVERSRENPSNIRDVYTGAWVSIIGVSIDHMVDWEQFAEQHDVNDHQELEESYHEMDNLQVSGSRVNSGMVRTDPIEWMASPAHEEMMNQTLNPQGHIRLQGFIDEYSQVNDMSIQSIEESRRQEFFSHLASIQNPRDGARLDEPINAMRLMMAFSHARHIAGVNPPEPVGMSGEDDATAMEP